MMTDFCIAYFSNVPFIAKTFLVTALAIAVMSALVGLYRVYKTPLPAPPTEKVALAQVNASALTPFMEALKGLLETLAKGPAWFAMFLAGLLLFWVAGEQYRSLCKPQAPQSSAAQPQGQAQSGRTSTQPGATIGNSQSPAGNGQAPVGAR